MDLARFIGEELVGAIAGLGPESLAGPWPAALRRRRMRGRFRAEFYSEDHAHPRFEICHLLAGTCAMSFRHEHYRLRQGDLFLIPPDEAHAETYWRPDRSYRLAWWVFTEAGPVVHVTEYRRRTRFKIVERISSGVRTPEMRDKARLLEHSSESPRPPRTEAVKEALLTLALSLLRHTLAEKDDHRGGGRRRIIEEARDFIAGHPDRPLTVTQVANEVMLSPNYLTTLFRAETGLSLGSYIKRERVSRAKELLTETRKSVKEIAYELGFEDPYSFSRTFKRVEGISPLHYRRGST